MQKTGRTKHLTATTTAGKTDRDWDNEKLLRQLLNAGNKERSAAKKQRAVELIKQYSNLTELTTELLTTLIEKIVVHEAVKSPDRSIVIPMMIARPCMQCSIREAG